MRPGNTGEHIESKTGQALFCKFGNTGGMGKRLKIGDNCLARLQQSVFVREGRPYFQNYIGILISLRRIGRYFGSCFEIVVVIESGSGAG